MLLASDCVAVAAVFPEPFRAGWLAGVIGFHLVAAALLRQWAALRWQRIDWLRIRPVRDARARTSRA